MPAPSAAAEHPRHFQLSDRRVSCRLCYRSGLGRGYSRLFIFRVSSAFESGPLLGLR